MNRKTAFVLFVLIALVAFSAMPATLTAQDEPFRVAAVAPSAVNDLAFSQSMYDALMYIQEELGEENFEFVFQEGTFIVDDAAVALRDWASSGQYDLIIAHGSQYGSILEELAPDFPDIPFAWGTDNNTYGLDNVSAYEAASDEGGYVLGVMAANLTETGVIGIVGPIEVGDAKLYVDGFVDGVLSTNPDLTVNTIYIGSFGDVPLATEAAETHFANGADILTGTAQMVVGPIAIAKENDLLWLGTQASQAELAEGSGVAFQIYHWEVVLLDLIERIGEGDLGGDSYTVNLENGGLTIEFSESFEMSDELAEIVEATIQGIIDGDIVPLDDAEEAE